MVLNRAWFRARRPAENSARQIIVGLHPASELLKSE
jgi:hypothetical protein